MSAEEAVNQSTIEVVHLLWTGGWDSTFRLIQLLVATDVNIAPIYVIDPDRKSSLLEIKTMAVLRRMLQASFPSAQHRILPHRYFSKEDIPPDPEITKRYRKLRERAVLGNQYDWLARLAKSNQIPALELSVHVDDKAHGFIKDHTIKKRDDQIGDYYELASEQVLSPESDLALFSYFRFPILDWSKIEMRDYASKKNVLDIMMNTWFCFTPIRNRPCGVCSPCRYALAEGMKERFSGTAHIRNRAVKIVPSLRRIWMRLL
jgi:hypothetical protein